MKTTVKRVLWQRTLETAGPLRKPLPTGMGQQWEGFFSRMQAIVDRGEERKRLRAKREAQIFGMDFAAGGVRDQTGVCLVGESGPELMVTIPAGALKVGEPVDFSDLFLLSLPQMVREMNEASGGCDADVHD